MKVFTLLFFLSLTFTAFSEPLPDWVKYTRELQLEGKEQEALKKLSQVKDVSQQVAENVKGQSPYLMEAVSAVAALKKSEAVPLLLQTSVYPALDLFQRMKILATINGLATKEQLPQVFKFYQKEFPLLNTKVAPATRVAHLELYRKNPKGLTPDVLDQLLTDESFELRVAATQIAGSLAQSDKSFDRVLLKGLALNPYQVREAAAYALKNLPTERRKSFAEAIKSCKKDENENVRKACAGL